jgi:PAS domain S-box-containing protein
VTFTDLRPGTYTFRVKASNSDGVWGETSRTAVRVTVTPPFWGTWWFRSLALGLLALALLGVHRLRVRHLTAALAERQTTEEALRQAEEKYRSIFENAFDGLFQTSPEGRFLAANPALARMLGYASPDVLMAEVADMGQDVHVDPDQQRALLTLIEMQGAVQSFECELRRRDGGTLWVSLNEHGVRDERGTIIRYEGTVEDISGRRHADELRELLHRSRHMTAMGSLVAGVAHEVRNPLFAISANLDAFEASTDTAPEAAPLIATIHREVDRLTALMQDLLDFGKPVKWSPSPGSLDGVLGDAFQLCAGLATEKGVGLSRSVAPDLPELLMDRKRLVQVFQNLLANAIQHSPRGGTVSVRAIESGGHTAVVTVQDEGRGFEAADLPRVFEPFFSRRKGGTGLGLAIVQRIVEEHGGTVTAGNGVAGGGMMTILLPLTSGHGEGNATSRP